MSEKILNNEQYVTALRSACEKGIDYGRNTRDAALSNFLLGQAPGVLGTPKIYLGEWEGRNYEATGAHISDLGGTLVLRYSSGGDFAELGVIGDVLVCLASCDSGGDASDSEEEGSEFVLTWAAGLMEDQKQLLSGLRSRFACRETKPKPGWLHVIQHSHGATHISPVSRTIGSELIRTNYAKHVIEKYDLLKSELSSSTPAGRLAIVNGEPGTGKTWLLRGLIQEIVGPRFVYCSPDLFSKLSDPDTISALGNGHTILIVEDGDEVIRDRKGGNIKALQAVLNLSDGLLGAALDIRVLITTNLNESELDSAVSRQQRLITHIRVPRLNAAESWEALEAIIGRKTSATEMMRLEKQVGFKAGNASLAEVYTAARAAGWKPQ